MGLSALRHALLCCAVLCCARSLARSLGSVRFGSVQVLVQVQVRSLRSPWESATHGPRTRVVRFKICHPATTPFSLRTQVLSRGAFRPTFIPALDMSDAWTKPDPYLHEDTAEGDAADTLMMN